MLDGPTCRAAARLGFREPSRKHGLTMAKGPQTGRMTAAAVIHAQFQHGFSCL